MTHQALNIQEIQMLASKMKQELPSFKQKEFLEVFSFHASKNEFNSKYVAQILRDYLPFQFSESLRFILSLPIPNHSLITTDIANHWVLPLFEYVELYGQRYANESYKAYELLIPKHPFVTVFRNSIMNKREVIQRLLQWFYVSEYSFMIFAMNHLESLLTREETAALKNDVSFQQQLVKLLSKQTLLIRAKAISLWQKIYFLDETLGKQILSRLMTVKNFYAAQSLVKIIKIEERSNNATFLQSLGFLVPKIIVTVFDIQQISKNGFKCQIILENQSYRIIKFYSILECGSKFEQFDECRIFSLAYREKGELDYEFTLNTSLLAIEKEHYFTAKFFVNGKSLGDRNIRIEQYFNL